MRLSTPRRWLAATALLLLGLFGAIWWQSRAAPSADPVETARLERGSLAETLALSGELVNDRTVTLTALMDGEIVTIGAREGEAVAARDVVARFDDTLPRAEVERVRADLVRRRAEADDARENLRRAESLAREDNVSAQQLDDARLARVRAESDVASAEAALVIAIQARENATIRAPFAGVIIDLQGETGQWMEAGTPIGSLAATAGRRIETWVDASSIGAVEIGQVARLSSDAWPDLTWESEVEWIAPTIASDDRRLNGEVPPNSIAIRLPPGVDAPALRLGQQVDIELETRRGDDALIVPLSALDERVDGSYAVHVLRAGDRVAVPVTLGVTTAERAEIRGAVDVDERYVVNVASPVDSTELASP